MIFCVLNAQYFVKTEMGYYTVQMLKYSRLQSHKNVPYYMYVLVTSHDTKKAIAFR